MFVTVAICTFNRAESLRRTLDSLAAMRVARDLAWELVVVNNNSTDHTDAVIAEYRDRLPLRREFEPLQGHSNARNRAIAAARGEYIVWTDDDVIVGAGWLAAYAEAFRHWPDAVVFGGRIKPRYEPPVARWVAESERVLGGPFAIRDFGDEVQPLSVAESRIPYGANFAVRTAEQRVFRYDPDLGLAPDRRRYDDEVDVITRLLTSGSQGILGTASNCGALHRPGAANGRLHRRVQRRLGRNLRVSRCKRGGPIVVLVWHSEQDLAATVYLGPALSSLPLRVAGALLGQMLTSLLLQ